MRILLISSLIMLGSCGSQYCDDIVYDVCFVYGVDNVDPDDMRMGLSTAHKVWERSFNVEIDFAAAATKYKLVVYFENHEDFNRDNSAGYFWWGPDLLTTPRIHIEVEEDNDEITNCLVGFVMGHEAMHFLDHAVWARNWGHKDPKVWMKAAEQEGSDPHDTMEYEVYSTILDYCEEKLK